jgi:NAD(P)H-flavin reductase
MPLQHFRAKVSQIRDLTHDVREITLDLLVPSTISFKAGQFISFEVPALGSTRLVTRPYSIASPPRQSAAVTLVLNVVPNGPGSTYLFSLRPGVETTFRGPAGSFYLRDDSSRHVLFVATGTGIAPIWSMLQTLVERNDDRRLTLFWGLRTERDLYHQDELNTWSTTRPNFHSVVTLSRPSGQWRGAVGRVTKLVESNIDTVNNLEAYLCGNSGMIKDVTGILREKGLCPIYREKYYDDIGGEGD